MSDPLIPFDEETGEPLMWRQQREDEVLERALEGVVPARAAAGLDVWPACLQPGCEFDCCWDEARG